jgi:arylsulfatase A-like enzyme
MQTIPEYFREAGYYTVNQRLRGVDRWGNKGKEDYNFEYNSADLYDGRDWSGRAEGQPFFAQVQLGGGKTRGAKPPNPVDPETVILPPHYPNDPVLKKDWANYLNSVMLVDQQMKTILERLREEGVLKNTVIFFFTDHGISHARGKQFCYEEGAHIPLIVAGESYVGKGVRNELVSHIDIAATSLDLAGIKVPEYMEGRTLFGEAAQPRQYVITARDRCDETVDRIRSVRMGDYLYIRNYLPLRPMLQPNAYKDRKAWMIRLRELHAAGQLNGLQERLLFAERRPEEELYNLTIDPHQYVNLATEPNMQGTLESMRAILHGWEIRAGDQGRTLEPHDVVVKENQRFIESVIERGQPQRAEVMYENLELMRRWAEAGK